MFRKLCIIATLFVLSAPVVLAQTYDGTNINWTLTQDVSQSSQWCNPTPCRTVWHTGYVYITAKNLRTNQVVTKSDTGTGRIVTVSASLPAQANDIVQYTETQTVTCTVMGTLLNITFTWYVEVAKTQSRNTGLNASGTYYDDYDAVQACQFGLAPDYNRNPITDSHNSNPWGWLYQGLCTSSTGHAPWSCGGGYATQVRLGTSQPDYPCTHNP